MRVLIAYGFILLVATCLVSSPARSQVQTCYNGALSAKRFGRKDIVVMDVYFGIRGDSGSVNNWKSPFRLTTANNPLGRNVTVTHSGNASWSTSKDTVFYQWGNLFNWFRFAWSSATGTGTAVMGSDAGGELLGTGQFHRVSCSETDRDSVKSAVRK